MGPFRSRPPLLDVSFTPASRVLSTNRISMGVRPPPVQKNRHSASNQRMKETNKHRTGGFPSTPALGPHKRRSGRVVLLVFLQHHRPKNRHLPGSTGWVSCPKLFMLLLVFLQKPPTAITDTPCPTPRRRSESQSKPGIKMVYPEPCFKN